MPECFNAVCGYDDDHDHGPECTNDCPCGLGGVDLAQLHRVDNNPVEDDPGES